MSPTIPTDLVGAQLFFTAVSIGEHVMYRIGADLAAAVSDAAPDADRTGTGSDEAAFTTERAALLEERRQGCYAGHILGGRTLLAETQARINRAGGDPATSIAHRVGLLQVATLAITAREVGLDATGMTTQSGTELAPGAAAALLEETLQHLSSDDGLLLLRTARHTRRALEARIEDLRDGIFTLWANQDGAREAGLLPVTYFLRPVQRPNGSVGWGDRRTHDLGRTPAEQVRTMNAFPRRGAWENEVLRRAGLPALPPESLMTKWEPPMFSRRELNSRIAGYRQKAGLPPRMSHARVALSRLSGLTARRPQQGQTSTAGRGVG